MKRVKNKKRMIIQISWLAVILWMILIYNLSSQVAEQSDKLSKGVTEIIIEIVERVAPKAEFDISSYNHIVRKYAHFFAYLVLGILVTAMRKSGRNSLKGVVLTLSICVLYAISDEVHQFFVQGRGSQVTDVLIDSAGAMVGIGVYMLIDKMVMKRKKSLIS